MQHAKTQMRHAARKDDNKTAIVEGLRAAGHEVYDLKLPVDLLVGIAGSPGVTLPMEIKDGAKPPSKRRLTDVQSRFIASWPAPVAVVTDLEGALRACRVIREA